MPFAIAWCLIVFMSVSVQALPYTPLEDEPTLPTITKRICIPFADLVRYSQYFGLVVVVHGKGAERFVRRVWMTLGHGEVGPLDMTVIVFFDSSYVSVSPIHVGVSCTNIIVSKSVWDAAVESLSEETTP